MASSINSGTWFDLRYLWLVISTISCGIFSGDVMVLTAVLEAPALSDVLCVMYVGMDDSCEPRLLQNMLMTSRKECLQTFQGHVVNI